MLARMGCTVPRTSWGHSGIRSAATFAVVAVTAAAFLTGVAVGSAQAAARATDPVIGTGRPGHSLPLRDDGFMRIPPPPASHGSDSPPEEGPACSLAEERTTLDPWRRWNALVLDTSLALRPRDVPPDLVDTAQAALNGGHLVRAIVIDDLRAMARAARAAGAGLAIQSAYRSHAEQVATFAYWVAAVGRPEALGSSARPGHSEHQLGTTIDFTSANAGSPPWKRSDWGRSRPGAWLMRHAWRYGFVLSYPRGARSVTCYAYEPWHWRYVGRHIAAAIHASGLAPREWLLR